MLGALGLVWGSNFTLIKASVGEIPPATLTFVRMALGAVLLVGVAVARGVTWPRDGRTWLVLLVLSLFGSGIPHGLVAWSEQTVPSGLAAVLMALMPIAVIVLAHLSTHDERLRWRTVAGVLLGFGGVVVLVGVDALSGLGHAVGAELALAGAALCFAINAVIARKVSHVSPLVVGAATLSLAAAYTFPIALATEQPWTLTPSAQTWGFVAVLGLVGTGGAALLYFAIVNRAGATFLALSNYLVPVVGVVLGALFLGETLTPQAWITMAMVMAGLALARR